MPNERRKSQRTYDGKIASDLPILPLRLTATGLVSIASAISAVARSIRFIADSYDAASESEKEYANSKITRAIKNINDTWQSLIKQKGN